MKLFFLSLVLSAATAAHATKIYDRDSDRTWRDYELSLKFNFSDGGLIARMTVGTPGQTVWLVVNTGSADTWVVSSDADRCEDALELCESPFTPNKSESFRLLDNDGFDLWYSQIPATGATFIDDVTIAGARVSGLQMGLGRNVPAVANPLGKTGLGAADTVMGSVGVLGLGFPEAEAGVDLAFSDLHPTLVDQLYVQEYITMRAYSLCISDPLGEYSKSVLVFGKVDFESFDGPLVPLPALRTFPINAERTSWPYVVPAVTLVNLEVLPDGADDNSTKATPIPLPAQADGWSIATTLDTSRLLSHVPERIATPLFEAVDAYVGPGGTAYVDCASTAAVRLVFGGTAAEANVTVVVKAEQLALDVVDQTQLQQLPPDSFPDSFHPAFSRTCLFAIQNLDAEHGPDVPAYTFARLGTAVMSALYLVVNVGQHEVGVAQSTGRSGGVLEELPANATSLPTDWVSRDGRRVFPATATGTPTSAAGAGGQAGRPVFALACVLLSVILVWV